MDVNRIKATPIERLSREEKDALVVLMIHQVLPHIETKNLNLPELNEILHTDQENSIKSGLQNIGGSVYAKPQDLTSNLYGEGNMASVSVQTLPIKGQVQMADKGIADKIKYDSTGWGKRLPHMDIPVGKKFHKNTNK